MRKQKRAKQGHQKPTGVIPSCTLVLLVMALANYLENTVGVAAGLRNLAAEPGASIESGSQFGGRLIANDYSLNNGSSYYCYDNGGGTWLDSGGGDPCVVDASCNAQGYVPSTNQQPCVDSVSCQQIGFDLNGDACNTAIYPTIQGVLIDNDSQSYAEFYFDSNNGYTADLGDWIRVTLGSAPVQFNTIYLSTNTQQQYNQDATDCSYCYSELRLYCGGNVYCDANVILENYAYCTGDCKWAVNNKLIMNIYTSDDPTNWSTGTLCSSATEVMNPDGVFHCPATAKYIYIVRVWQQGTDQDNSFQINTLKVFAETEQSSNVAQVSTPASGSWVIPYYQGYDPNYPDPQYSRQQWTSPEPLFVLGNTPLEYQGYAPLLEVPSNEEAWIAYILDDKYSITSLFLETPNHEYLYSYSIPNPSRRLSGNSNIIGTLEVSVTVEDPDTGIITQCTPNPVDLTSPNQIKEVECGGAAGNEIKIKDVTGSQYLSFKKVAIFADELCSDYNQMIDSWSTTLQLQVGGTATYTQEYSNQISCNLVTVQVQEAYNWLQVIAPSGTPLSSSKTQVTISEDSLTCEDIGSKIMTMQIEHYGPQSLSQTIIETNTVEVVDLTNFCLVVTPETGESSSNNNSTTIAEEYNAAPYFEEELVNFHWVSKIQRDLELNSTDLQDWQYQLPAIYDPEGDIFNVETNMDGAENFVIYDESQNAFKISDLSDPLIETGTFTVGITLKDEKDAYSEYNITLSIHEVQAINVNPDNANATTTDENVEEDSDGSNSDSGTIEEEVEAETKDEDFEETPISTKVFDWEAAFEELERRKKKAAEDEGEKYQPPQPPQAKIEEISPTGLVSIKFTEDMQEESDLSFIKKSSAFSMHIVSGEYTEPSKLGYSWEPINMDKRSLQLQIAFENPLFVSTEYEPEVLEIKISDGAIFLSVDGLPLQINSPNQYSGLLDQKRELQEEDDSSLKLQSKIPKQDLTNEDDKAAMAAFEGGAIASQVTFVGNFFLNLFMSASLNQLWSMVNTQQLLVLLPLCKVTLPVNASNFFETIFQIAAFAFYDTNDMFHFLLGLEESEPYNDNLGELGFESRYMLNNMGTMLIFYIVYPIVMIIERIAYRLKNRYLCCRQTQRYLRNNLYYSALIVAIFESYALVALCCFIALPVLDFSSIGLAVQSLACISFSIWIIVAPIIAIRNGVKNTEYLRNRRTKRRIGKLYEDLLVSKGAIIFYQPAFFLIRRLMLVVAVTVFSEVLIAQIYIIISQSLINLIIMEYTKPFKTQKQRSMELFNEIILMLVMYTIICFTPWVESIETKVKIGYVSCFLVTLHFVVNLTIILQTSLRATILDRKTTILINKKEQQRIKQRESFGVNKKKREERRKRLEFEANLELIVGEEYFSDDLSSSRIEEESLSVSQSSSYEDSDVSSEKESVELSAEDIAIIRQVAHKATIMQTHVKQQNQQQEFTTTQAIDHTQVAGIGMSNQQQLDDDEKNFKSIDLNDFEEHVKEVLRDDEKFAEMQKMAKHVTFQEIEQETQQILQQKSMKIVIKERSNDDLAKTSKLISQQEPVYDNKIAPQQYRDEQLIMDETDQEIENQRLGLGAGKRRAPLVVQSTAHVQQRPPTRQAAYDRNLFIEEE